MNFIPLLTTAAQRPTRLNEVTLHIAIDTLSFSIGYVNAVGATVWISSPAISGAGTPNTIAKFVTATSLGNSQSTDDGNAISISAATTAFVGGVTGLGLTSGAALTLNALAGAIIANATAGISLNGANFLGSTTVGGLSAGIFVGLTPAFAYVTDLRVLATGSAYPTIQGAGAGTGGLAVRNTTGTWKLVSTDITAQA